MSSCELAFDHSIVKELRPIFEWADQSVVVIDPQMVVRYVSPKAQAMWRLNNEQCQCSPPFADFIYNIAAAGAYDIEADALEEYVLERFRTVEAGDPRPVDIRLPDNRVVRAQCTLLPDGSRLLTHTDVTDLVLRAEHFRDLANVDPLTGLPNRYIFLDRGQAEWHRFRRYHHPFSVLTLCIEGLEMIEAQFGAEMVNRAVIHASAICVGEKRITDFVARIAPAKFGVLLPHTSEEQARVFAGRLRTAVACYPLYFKETPIRLSIAWGAAESKPDMSGIAALLKAAEGCLRKTDCVDPAERTHPVVTPLHRH